MNRVIFTVFVLVGFLLGITRPTFGQSTYPIHLAKGENGNVYSIQLIFTDGQTWRYEIKEISGQSLSHFTLGMPVCVEREAILDTDGNVGSDPTTGQIGIKWDLPENFTEGIFEFYMNDTYPMGEILVAFKAGNGWAGVFVEGPDCSEQVIPTPTNTTENTPTNTPRPSATPTATETPTTTPEDMPTATSTSVSTPLPTVTVDVPTITPTSDITPKATDEPTLTPTATLEVEHPMNEEETAEPLFVQWRKLYLRLARR